MYFHYLSFVIGFVSGVAFIFFLVFCLRYFFSTKRYEQKLKDRGF